MEYPFTRHKTNQVKVGNVMVGGDAPITVQSMTTTDTSDVAATVEQIEKLTNAGCDIVRCAVPDIESADAVYKIKERIKIPIVADIHFDYKLAVRAAEAGADKIRINPGNIGGEDRVKIVADCCNARNIPIRIGINGGSLQKDILHKYGSPTPEALCESASRHIKLLENADFNNIIVAIKTSNVSNTIEANKLFAAEFDYPLHIGVTEAGTAKSGTMKNAVCIGALLSCGIGDTIRVSLTADPTEEIAEGINILRTLGIRCGGINIVACPTCGRTKIDILKLASDIEEKTRYLSSEFDGRTKTYTVAVMGCAVNGPGEASEADIGIAGGVNEALLFKHGKPVGKVNESDIIDTLINEINGDLKNEYRKSNEHSA
jgi:(E)-4-hydroxy-3-methylbut-2-enyl-diphosphate synthase